jgi:hypothetical protein
MEFPDTIPSKESMWATYIPARSPEFKVHKTLGLARSAMGQRSYDESYALYEMQGGQWVKTFEYHPAEMCGICGWRFNNGTDRWARVRYESMSKASKWTKGPICAKCYGIQRDQIRREAEERRELAELKRLQNKYT